MTLHQSSAPPADFGILALGSSLGELRDVATTAHEYGARPERVLRLGYRTYRWAPDDVTCTELAARAGRVALARAGVDGAEVDFLLVATGSVPEYLNWDFSTAVARALRLRGTPTLLLTQGCASAVLAFQQVAGLFATRQDVRTVLLVAADRVDERESNRMRANVESDGAAAVLFRRGHDGMRWLATEQHTDAEYADFFRQEYGGTAAPVAPEGRSNRDLDPAHQVYLHFRDDPAGLTKFAGAVDRRVVNAVTGACKVAGTNVSALSRLILLNDNRPSMAGIAELLGIPLDRTNADLSGELGHAGGADPLICLDLYREQGTMLPGDLVALAGMSSGMHWFCTLIEV
ncbi:3-oxoacyl-ACP synthase III family protein [Streptomyces sp. NPDC056347]|uniref:3-oxoacyl-ACP synthase III family protein n=1 Tax=Streptomyces sp. NPDC056347 TaxID=3345790 RepID=UPI0035E1FFE2